jgi:hypothetical protein
MSSGRQEEPKTKEFVIKYVNVYEIRIQE